MDLVYEVLLEAAPSGADHRAAAAGGSGGKFVHVRATLDTLGYKGTVLQCESAVAERV